MNTQETRQGRLPQKRRPQKQVPAGARRQRAQGEQAQQQTGRLRQQPGTTRGDITVIPLGGFSEVGRNCVAIKVDDDVFILDMGLAIDKYIEYTEKESYDEVKVSGKKLIEIGAAPDINLLGDDRRKVKAIILTHAHLDHILAVPYLANRFGCPLYATPFTAELVKTITDDERMPLHEDLIVRNAGDRWKLTDNVECEFVHLTHSTPQTVAAVLHTHHGTAIYAPDFKFDEHPTKGERSDTDRLSQLKGADVLIMDSLYAHKEGKVPSENYARSMLFNVLTPEKTEGRVVIATTFASSVYRLQTLLEVAKRLGRRPVFLGRSMSKYIFAAEKLGIANFTEQADVVAYGTKVRSFLRKVRNPEEYFFIATGNQGEPKAVLSKMITGGWLEFREGDLVVFSCITIPVEPNITYRANLEAEIERRKMEVVKKNVHVSGHGAQEDHKKMLKLVRPKHVIPMHAEPYKLEMFRENAKKIGFRHDQVHILKNGERLHIRGDTFTIGGHADRVNPRA